MSSRFGYRAVQKGNDVRNFNNEAEYHEASKSGRARQNPTTPNGLRILVKTFNAAVFGAPEDTLKFLQWVHDTNAVNPNDLDVVDDHARQRWRAMITSVRAIVEIPPPRNSVLPL